MSNPSIFNFKFIQMVREALEQNRPVRHKFSHWGRLHIDRRLPFLCIYRRPSVRPDIGTERLLLGQASYILIREEDADSKDFKALVNEIMAYLSKVFGSAMLFELWSEEGDDFELEEQEKRPLLLAIKTTRKQAPLAMLERFESALWEIPFENRSREISLDYGTQYHPPLMPPILSNKELANGCYFWVGLSITPIYRKGEDLFPYILRDLHHWLTLALRRSFFTFTRRYTKHKPAHFHQLGQRSLTQSVWSTDKQLAEIKEQFEILFHVTPVNSDEAWSEFQQSGFIKIPAFNYRPRPIDPDLLKRQLYQIPIERIEDPTLAYIFQSQRDDIDRQLNMINDRNSRNFLYGSLQVYGGVAPWLLKLAYDIMDKVAPESASPVEVSLSATEFIKRAETILAGYRKDMPELQARIEIRSDIPGVMVSKGNLMIGRHSRFLKDEVEAILAHEVGTHIVTYFNGKVQPFHQFYSGMANYEPLQEGLAILAEYLVGQLKPRRIKTLAARVIAVNSVIQGADFIAVFRQLHRDFDISAYQAYFITMRVFRGGGFTKDAVYLKGFSHLLDYLGKGGDLDILYLGKIAQENIPFVEELRWRKVLKDSPLKPHYLKTEQSKCLLERIRQGITVLDLIEGIKHEIGLGSQ